MLWARLLHVFCLGESIHRPVGMIPRRGFKYYLLRSNTPCNLIPGIDFAGLPKVAPVLQLVSATCKAVFVYFSR